MHPAKMTFQALRIAVNREFEEFRDGLAAALNILREGGKIGVLTWKHSECDILVDFARRNEIASHQAPLRLWYERSRAGAAGKQLKKVRKTVGVVVEEARRPTPQEVKDNSRSRSAVLHVLRRETGMRVEDIERESRPVLGWEPYPSSA